MTRRIWTGLVMGLALTPAMALAQAAQPAPPPAPPLTLTTTAFPDGGVIPNKYTQVAEQVSPGFLADVVVFDPASVADKATFEDPHQLSVGVRDVWVNGVRVLDAGEHTGATPGRSVDGPGRKQAKKRKSRVG